MRKCRTHEVDEKSELLIVLIGTYEKGRSLGICGSEEEVKKKVDLAVWTVCFSHETGCNMALHRDDYNDLRICEIASTTYVESQNLQCFCR
jgi:hypothetical protein